MLVRLLKNRRESAATIFTRKRESSSMSMSWIPGSALRPRNDDPVGVAVFFSNHLYERRGFEFKEV